MARMHVTSENAERLDEVLALLKADKIAAPRLCKLVAQVQSDELLRARAREALGARFALLERDPALVGEALKTWRKQRGYRLEELLVGLMAIEGLRPEPSFRPRGEQIDALFELRGRHFLVEAKWTSIKQPASAIYEFQGKVEGKLVGTIGVFVAMGGFAPDAAETLARGKEMKVLLVDGDDVRSAFAGEVSWERLIDMKCRQAAQHGHLYYTWKQEKDREDA